MSRKGKITLEEKVKIIREYEVGNISIREAARRAGVVDDVLRRWSRSYRHDGVLGLTPDKKNRVYSPELKKTAVSEYISGSGSQNEICEKYGIRSRNQLRSWIKIYNAHGDLNSVKQSGGGSYMKQGRSTTLEERIEICKYCIASDKNYGEAALKYNVSYQQARTWTLRYEELGEAGLQDRRGQRKKDQIPRTELEQA